MPSQTCTMHQQVCDCPRLHDDDRLDHRPIIQRAAPPHQQWQSNNATWKSVSRPAVAALLHYCNTSLVQVWHGAHPIDCTPAYNRPLHWLQSASEFQSLPPAFLPTAPSLMDEQFPKDCCSNQLNSEEIWRKASDDDVWKVFNAAIVSCRRLSNKQMHKLGSLSSGTPPLAERWQINLRRGEFEFSHPALAPELSPSKIGRISWMI